MRTELAVQRLQADVGQPLERVLDRPLPMRFGKEREEIFIVHIQIPFIIIILEQVCRHFEARSSAILNKR
jgi:hypothetical protein